MNQNEINEAVKGVKKGNSKCVTLLYEAFYKEVYYVCVSMVKDEETSKDLTSDIFVTAFSKILQLKKDEAFRGWLISIASRTCLDYLKRKKIIEFTGLDDDNISEIPDKSAVLPEEAAIDNEIAEILQAAISKLPEEQRICIFMFYYENYSVSEIAEIIGCSENTVRGRLRYANANLRKQIDNLGDEGIKLRAVAALPFMYIIFKASYNKVYAGVGITETEALLTKLSKSNSIVKSAGRLSKGKIIGICAGIAACVAAGTIIFTNAGKSGKTNADNSGKYETEENNNKPDDAITGAKLIDSGKGCVPHIYGNRYFVNSNGGYSEMDKDRILYKDANGNIIYENDKIDDRKWSFHIDNDYVDMYKNDGFVCMYESDGSQRLFGINKKGDIILDEEAVYHTYFAEWHLGDNYVFLGKTDNENDILIKSISLKDGSVNYANEIKNVSISHREGYFLIFDYRDDTGEWKQKVVNLESGKEVGNYDRDALIYGMEHDYVVLNRTEYGKNSKSQYISEYLAYDGDGKEIFSKKFEKDDGFELLGGDGNRKYTTINLREDGKTKTYIVNCKLEPIAEYDDTLRLYGFYGKENRDVYAFYQSDFGVLIEGDEVTAEFGTSDGDNDYPYFSYFDMSDGELNHKYVYYHTGAILNSYAIKAGDEFYLTDEEKYTLYDKDGKIVAAFDKENESGINEYPVLNEKGNKVIYRKNGNLFCYDAETETEKELCEIPDNAITASRLFRDNNAVIFEKDNDTYHVFIVNINDGAKTKLFDTEFAVISDMSDELISVTNKEQDSFELYKIG